MFKRRQAHTTALSSRRRSFRLLAGGVAAIATAGLLRESTPRMAHAQPTPAIVGSWTVFDPGNQSQNVATFIADGGLITTRAPLAPPPPVPGFQGAYLTVSAGQGVWAATKDGTVAYTFVDFSYDDRGGTVGMLTLTGSLTLDDSGNSATGPCSYTITTPTGEIASRGAGNFQLARIVLTTYDG